MTPLLELKVELSEMAGATGAGEDSKFVGTIIVSPAFMKEFLQLCGKYYSWAKR